MASVSAAERFQSRNSRSKAADMCHIDALDHDLLCKVFALLNLFELARCSSVCKTWNTAISRSEILQVLYHKKLLNAGLGDSSSFSEKPLNQCVEELALNHHKLCLERGSIKVLEWQGHSVGVNQCRMKMGLALTGVGDKVMRLWSVHNNKYLEEYQLPDQAPLIDFDFDETKIVSLVGTQLCIWRRDGKRSVFPSHEGTFSKGLCMRYMDPEAVVGCENGETYIFDMYSGKCSQIIRMHEEPITCLSLGEDQLIFSGSSLGKITVSGLSSHGPLAILRTADSAGIRTLCYNQRSHLVFSGSSSGHASCWDLRKMSPLWEARVSQDAICSMQNLQNDTFALAVGGVDGVLRLLDQNSGAILARCVISGSMPAWRRYTTHPHEIVERREGRRLAEYIRMDELQRSSRPPIRCLAVGMNKVITTHGDKYVRVWKFFRKKSP